MTLDDRHLTWANSNRFLPRTFVRPFIRFTQVEAASGILLLIAAVVAVIWANSPWADSYHTLFGELHLEISFGPFHFDESFGELINDGLMVIFFFVVGLEIKRELVLGELRDRKAAALPVFAALGGMAVPAAIYLAFNAGGDPDAIRGWGIPMATDIAFAVGVISLLGKRVPTPGKLFILALAIADDIGAITVIAIFYTSDLDLGWLGLALAALVMVVVAQKVGIRSLAVYTPAGLFIWYAMLESGVHATLAGVALGLLTPALAMYPADELDRKARQILDTYPPGTTVLAHEQADHEARLLSEISRESIAPLNRLVYKLLPWSSFVVVPLFALANAGVGFAGTDVASLATDPVALGVGVGLLVGKPVGIVLFVWLALKMGLGRLPRDTGWRQMWGLGLVAGIGFTVALFVTSLAFPSETLADSAKVGIFGGSIVAAVLGSLVLFLRRPQSEGSA